MVDVLLEPWRSGIGQRALAEVVLLAGVGGALGFWVTRLGLAYGAESLAHGLLPGLVLAAIVGAPLLAGAAGGALLAAALVVVAARGRRAATDTATAVAVTGLLGLAGLLALAPAAPPRVGELVFGDPLGVGAGDLAAAGALAAVGGAALVLLHRPLAAVAFDPDGARALGLRPGAVRAALAVLLAAVVCVAVLGLGSLLVLALLVGPQVAVRRHARTPGGAMAAGAAVGMAAGVGGLYASFYLDTAAGASVALALCAAAGLGAVAPLRPRPRGRAAG